MTRSNDIFQIATRTLGCAAAALVTSSMLMALAAGPAHASEVSTPEGITKTMLVPYDDLNLASPSGMQTLQKRIESAARQVCADAKDRSSLTATAAYKECLANALAGAQAQVKIHQIAFNSFGQ